MSIKIGHASIDENGKIAGGNTGDQTTKEICTRLWYNKPWNVYLECTDPVLANKAATFMEQICADPDYGYDQNQRWTGYHSIVKNGNKVNGGRGEFDCATAIMTCYILAGLKLIPTAMITTPEKYTIYTGSIKDILVNTGKFKAYVGKAYVGSDKLAKRGGIYLSEGHHVVMALEDGYKSPNPYVEPMSTISIGDTGVGVKWIQFELGIDVDGEFGPITDKAVRDFQRLYGLVVDGKVGSITRKHLNSH